MVGKTISHYKILEKLGEGGMGVVYKAEDTKLKRTVALKFLPQNTFAGEEEKNRFIREAQSAASLEHSNIFTVYEIDEADGQIFIAMAFIDGESLKEKIEKGPMKLKEAVNIACQVCDGLYEAHEKGIVHRDIKPANIMITSKGQVKIMDFGLAKAVGRSRLTKTKSSMGTVAYMSPEQTNGEDVDSRSDVWSLGVVLYEMISGQLPFKGDYEQAILYSVMNEDAESLTSLRPGVPLGLQRVVEKALAKNPEERYQNVDEMLVDLRIVGNELESGTKKTAVPKRNRKINKKVVVIAGAAFLVLILMALGYIFLVGSSQTFDSIAIIPFTNDSGNPDMEYLSDGITESLISKLSRLSDLKVMSRHSVFRFKGKCNLNIYFSQESRYKLA